VKEEYFKRLVFLNPSEIIPPKDARKEYDRYKLFLLSESIRENGLLCPVTVKETEDGYEVISGEKRIKACIIAGLKKIPCIVTDFFDGELFRATEENAGQTVSLNEEADRLKELCKKYSLDTVARTLSFTTGELEKIVKEKQCCEEIEEPKKAVISKEPLEKNTIKEIDKKLIITAVVFDKKIRGIDRLIKILSSKLGMEFSLFLNVNKKDTNVIYGDEFYLMHGKV
jgi:ParB/RepB/Spo0J family partition protein